MSFLKVLKEHKLLIGSVVVVEVLAVFLLLFTPRGPAFPPLKQQYPLFALANISAILLVGLGAFLLLRWYKYARKDLSLLLWGIGFLQYSLLFIGMCLDAVGVSGMDMHDPRIFFSFRQTMIIFVSLLYLGGIIKLTENKYLTHGLTFLILVGSYGVFSYGLFIRGEIEWTMYFFLFVFLIPVSLLIANLFYQLGESRGVFSGKLLAVAWIYYAVTYGMWAPWHFPEVRYIYYIWFSQFLCSLVLMLVGFIILTFVELLQETEEKLQSLHDYGQLLNEAETMQEISKYTLDAMERTLGFQHAGFQLIEGNELKVKATRGFGSLLERVKSLPLDGPGVTVKVANTGKPIRLNDVSTSQEFLRGGLIMKSELAVPIKRGDKAIGVLNVEHEEVNAFDQKDQQLLETLSSHVAVAIKKLQEKKKRVSLQRLDRLRNQFLVMAAHEINTPLTPIKSRLEMLQRGYKGELSREQVEMVKSALKSVDRLVRLVDDFRRITKLRVKTIELEKEEHELATTIEEAIGKYKNVIEEEGIVPVLNIQQPLAGIYDPDRMVQVVRNLVENAIDYTDGRIWIKGWEEEEKICFSVRDNGSGIPEAEQKKIFQPFYRVEEDRRRSDRRFGGTGLGLNICKRIVKAHGGTISIESQLGEGSTFTVKLPKENTMR